MITFISGAPGAGKSSALVSMLREFAKDRAVYVHGIPDLKIPHQPLVDPHKWMSDVPDGSVIVIDEVQNHWRPRGPGTKVPDHVAALETHRHRGLDFYIISQGPNLVDSNVRALVGRHVHLRDLGILGRWWYEFPECADNVRTGWKNAPIKKRYRIDKKTFDEYKSASVHIKPVRSVPWMLAVMVLALAAVAGLTWKAYGSIQTRLAPVEAKKAVVAAPADTGPSPAGPHAAEPALLDERTAYIPRISYRPETAPAYDELRRVASMPLVEGALCMKGRCRCYTQQATDAGLSDAECRAWMQNPPFNPYKPPAPPPQQAQQAPYVVLAPSPQQQAAAAPQRPAAGPGAL